MTLTRLRDLPGVEAIEQELETHRHKRFIDFEMDDRAHDLATSLFGICNFDIGREIDDSEFAVERFMRDESDAYWASYGWDVTDGDGKQLAVMEFLLRPLVCLVRRLHPDARFLLADQAWAASLEDEARRFRASR